MFSMGAARAGEHLKRHQMRHLCDLPCLLAKQVLSQLSYTLTAGTFIDGRAFASVRKLQKHTFYPLLCQNCVKTPTGIVLALR